MASNLDGEVGRNNLPAEHVSDLRRHIYLLAILPRSSVRPIPNWRIRLVFFVFFFFFFFLLRVQTGMPYAIPAFASGPSHIVNGRGERDLIHYILLS